MSSFSFPLVGVDEVGRGCLAGPVFAAAVLFEDDKGSYRDSKTLSALQREKMSLEIENNYKYGIGFATVEEITELNILNASFLAMKRAVEKLTPFHGTVLVDGKFPIKGLDPRLKQTPVIQGDQKVSAIAAASIIAKVRRDKHLEELSKMYPDYGFEKHKGYGTVFHRKIIEQKGPCKEHRKTFKGVREFCS